MVRRNWTYDELLLAFNLYCKLSFGSFHSRNSEIIALAQLIDRTPSSIAMKLANFASLDPEQQKRGVKGLSNASKADQEVWDEFTSDWDNSIWKSELLLSEVKNLKNDKQLEATKLINAEEWINQDTDSTQTERVTKVRVGQRFFRNMILANYRSSCCVCEITTPKLLIASHIVPWSNREDLRLNPHNGLLFMCSP